MNDFVCYCCHYEFMNNYASSAVLMEVEIDNVDVHICPDCYSLYEEQINE